MKNKTVAVTILDSMEYGTEYSVNDVVENTGLRKGTVQSALAGLRTRGKAKSRLKHTHKMGGYINLWLKHEPPGRWPGDNPRLS